MRVVLVAVSSAQAMSGVTRHAINVARALLLIAEIEHVHVVAGAWQIYMRDAFDPDPRLSLELVDISRSMQGRNLWYIAGLPAIVREQHADLVHLAFPSPLYRRALGVPTIVTLHDLYPYDLPQNFGRWKALFNRIVLRRCFASADAIACVSQSTLARLNELDLSVASQSTCVVPNCIEPFKQPSVCPEGLNANDTFLLCVAQHRRNKNILLTLSVYLRLLEQKAIPDTSKLIIVGIDGPETGAIQEYLNTHQLKQRVILFSGLAEGQLRWCYEQCTALVVPSVVEGFGMPVVEGILAGCPIICSDIPALREVGGTACQYVSLDTNAEATFADAIVKAMQLQRPSPMTLPQYSLAQVSRQYGELYQSVLKVPRENNIRKISAEIALKQGRETVALNTAVARRTTKVLGIPIAVADSNSALTWIADDLDARRKGYVCFVSVHGLMQAVQKELFARCYAGASLLLPDGAPVAWVGRVQGESTMRRVAGPEFMLEFFGDPRFEKLTHFLYGGDVGVAQLLQENLSRQFPNANIVGTYTPPFRDLSMHEQDDLVELINNLQPDILWVGIGCPKQELFMQRFLPLLHTRLMFGVGAAFDIHTGRIHDSPALIKRMGLQWFHRLLQDPQRLWRRYLGSNSAFLWYLFLEKTRIRRQPPATHTEPHSVLPKVPAVYPSRHL